MQYAKHRTLPDEQATITAVDRSTGEARDVLLHELLANDAETDAFAQFNQTLSELPSHLSLELSL